jgi:BRCT domain type II-containing protein
VIDNGGIDGSGSTTTTTTSTTVPSTGNQTKDQLIDQAARALADADVALRNGDLAGYQAKVREAQSYLDRAQQLADAPS